MANKKRDLNIKKNSTPQHADYKNGYKTYESEQVSIDYNTGEIMGHLHQIRRVKDTEDDYIKLYLNTIMTFNGIQGISCDILIALCQNIQGYNNDDKTPLYFRADQLSKTNMSKSLNMSIAMVNKYIKKMVDSGILIKTDMRAVYIVNPWILARGKWSNISSLRANFDFINGQWSVDYKLTHNKDDNNEEG